MNVLRNAHWMCLCMGLSMLFPGGCVCPAENPAEQAREQQEAALRRQAWFQNAAGKPVSEQRSIETELLTGDSTPSAPRQTPENPYPIYREPPSEPPSPTHPTATREYDNVEKIQTELNFNAAALTDVIPVFAELLSFNYLLDGKLNGTVTLSIRDQLTRQQLWTLLEQVMRISHVYGTEQDGLIHFRPVETMVQDPVATTGRSAAEVAYFHLKNISAKETAAQISAFLSPGLKPLMLEERNLLLIVDTRENLRKIRSIIAELDRPLRQGWAKMVIPCRNIDAARLAAEAGEILPVLGFPIALNSEQPRPEEIQLTTVERLQIIVASAASYEALEELGRWIHLLDQTDSGDQERLFIYHILRTYP